MKNVATLPMPTSVAGTIRDFLELSKARIVLMVLLTTLAGFLVATGEGNLNTLLLLHTLVGTALVAGGTNALNQVIERDHDRRMLRTRMRPLPSGRMSLATALVFAVGVSALGTAYLAVLVHPLSAALGLFTLVTYLFVYTPMKRLTSMSTLIGAVPGAVPPLLGFAAVRGDLDLSAWLLFGILFLWQMPHFFAIGWLYREDYAQAGFSILSVNDPDGRRSGRQAVLYSLLLLPLSCLSSLMGMTGPVYLAIAVITGLVTLGYSWEFARLRTMTSARHLFLFSILYLPVIMTAFVVSVV